MKRNRVICPEIAVNSQFLPGKLTFFVKLPKKIEILWKFALNEIFFVKLPEKNRNFSDICPEKSFFGVCEIA